MKVSYLKNGILGANCEFTVRRLGSRIRLPHRDRGKVRGVLMGEVGDRLLTKLWESKYCCCVGHACCGIKCGSC